MGILFYLILLLWVWMLIDALMRPAPFLWILLLAFFPVAAIPYFLLVKIHDFKSLKLAGIRDALLPDSRLRGLREAAEQVPSLVNLLALGEELLRRRKLSEAREVLDVAFQREPNDLRAAYLLGRTCSAAEDFARAATLMAPVVAVEPAFRDYDAWLCLAHALWFSGRREEGLESMRKLAATTHRLQHQVLLADYLASTDLSDAARTVLEEALLEFDRVDPGIQRAQARWFRAAQRMLQRL